MLDAIKQRIGVIAGLGAAFLVLVLLLQAMRGQTYYNSFIPRFLDFVNTQFYRIRHQSCSRFPKTRSVRSMVRSTVSRIRWREPR